MKSKTYKNTPMGRAKIPNKKGSYKLLDKGGNIILQGTTFNLKRRIKEYHYDKTKDFSYIEIIIDKKNLGCDLK